MKWYGAKLKQGINKYFVKGDLVYVSKGRPSEYIVINRKLDKVIYLSEEQTKILLQSIRIDGALAISTDSEYITMRYKAKFYANRHLRRVDFDDRDDFSDQNNDSITEEGGILDKDTWRTESNERTSRYYWMLCG
jgi:hypothetical protein